MWQPQGSIVFIRKAAPREMTESGIVLPVIQQELTLEGEIAVSAHLMYPVGTKVLFSKFAGSDVKVGNEVLLIIRIEDILAVWQDGETNVSN